MNQERRKSFSFNLIVVILACIVLYISFFASLGFLTKHGSEIKIPSAVGRDIKPATQLLESMGFDVEVDSAYEPKQRPFIVLSQIPELNSIVKTGRTVFLTINKVQAPLISMPNLLNLSFRSADMILRSNKLVLGDTTLRPDIAKGAILEQLYRGKPVRPGQMLPQGSKIDLIVGDGLGNTQFNVPDVIGLTYEEAMAILNGTGLQLTAIWEEPITDSVAAVVYDQFPKALNELMTPNRIKEGDIVDIRIKQNPTTEELESNRNPAGPVIEETE